ncbi:MAG: preprotein translocase subunit SecG [Proteobacteria bacterium]|nr:preprotein translocase subunit SecG [Pseudomonadota bacterium]
MDTLLIVVHVIVCLFLVGIVLLQHGKGADIGASFGGSSQSLFGTEGPLPLLNKITTASAILFMLTSVTLAYMSSRTGSTSVMSDVAVSQPAQVQETQSQSKDDAVKDTPVENKAATEADTEKTTK